MTVPTETAIASLAWTGVETSFVPGFRALAVTDVVVIAQNAAGVQVTLTRNTHFSVALDGNGAVTVTPIALPTVPQTLIIYRATPAVQSVDFANLGSYAPAVHTRLHDAAALRDAEARRDLARALLVPEGEAGYPLPGLATRANGGLGSIVGFDGSGNLTLYNPADLGAVGASSVQIVTAAGTTTVAPATTALIFRKSVASPSPFNLPPGVDGAEIRIIDETGLAGDMTATPAGADNVMGVNGPMVVASSGGSPQSGGVAVLNYYFAIGGWVVSR